MFRLLLPYLCLAAPALAEPDMRVLVDREPSGVSVYFALDAAALPDVFVNDAMGITGPDGTVDIAGLYEGTFDTADEVFADVDTRVGDAPVTFEAISMMVHDPAILPAFTTPFEAAMSVAVCNSPETVREMRLESLTAFLGFYAWKADPLAEVVLTFPATGRAPLNVEVLDHAPSGEVRRSTMILADGGTMTFAGPDAARFASLAPLLGVVAGLVLAGGAVAAARKAKARVPQ